jgi:Zn-dependent peptidase ImmA (M78 family)/transcriptional regulator with XRE-family HTH domain
MGEAEQTVNPAWVIVGRESRNLTQKQMAAKLSISQGWLSRVESGLRGLPDNKLSELADLLDYPIEFFQQDEPVYGIGTSELFHRKRQAIPLKTLNCLYARINVREMNLRRLLKGIEIEGANIAVMEPEDFDGKVEDIARAVRKNWNVPRGPIQSVTEVIENAKGIMIPFDFETRKIDAVSHWLPGMPPLFFVNIFNLSDRIRLTLCHELGHMVMHSQSPNSDMEAQANAFAAEFLMPAEEIRPLLDNLSIPKLATLKMHWKVSMQALLYRAGALQTITPRHARTLWMQMSKLGYRTREPAELDFPMETPTLFNEIVDFYSHDLGYSASELAKSLLLTENELDQSIFKPTNYINVQDAITEAEQILRQTKE